MIKFDSVPVPPLSGVVSDSPWSSIVTFSQTVFDVIKFYASILIDIFFTPIKETINTITLDWEQNFVTGIVSDVLNWLIDVVGLGDYNLASIMLTAGLGVWIVVSLIKWLLDILP